MHGLADRPMSIDGGCVGGGRWKGGNHERTSYLLPLKWCKQVSCLPQEKPASIWLIAIIIPFIPIIN